MATFSGTAGKVESFGGGNAVEEVKEWSLDISASVINVGSFGDTWDENIISQRGFTGSFSLNDNEGTNLTFWKDGFLTGTTVRPIRFYLDDSNVFIGSALVTGFSDSISYDGVATTTFNITGTAELTYSG